MAQCSHCYMSADPCLLDGLMLVIGAAFDKQLEGFLPWNRTSVYILHEHAHDGISFSILLSLRRDHLLHSVLHSQSSLQALLLVQGSLSSQGNFVLRSRTKMGSVDKILDCEDAGFRTVSRDICWSQQALW